MTEIPTASLVPYRISICGLAELDGFCAANVSHVLSILDPDWPDPDNFSRYNPHRREVWRFHDIVNPRRQHVHPSSDIVQRILEFGAQSRDADITHLLVHCHAGISRSTATAVILMAQHNPGREVEAFDHLAEVRPKSWPNSLMLRLADDMLGRGGALVEAMRRHHHRVARAYPDWAEALRDGERARELPE